MVLATAVVLGAIAAPLKAQDTAATKPGGLNKVAHNVSKTMKKAGRDTKAEVHRDASKTHQTLTKAGNDTKAQLKRTTGVTTHSSVEPSSSQSFLPVSGSKLVMRLQPPRTICVLPAALIIAGVV